MQFVRRFYGVMVLLAVADARGDAPAQPAACLSPRNLEAPFPYVVGDTRAWPILERPLREGTRIQLKARDGDDVLGTGEQLGFRGLAVTVTPTGRLQVAAEKDAARIAFRLELTLVPPTGPPESQTLEVRPAPPDRAISYYADFGDDLVSIFMNSTSGKFRPVTKSGFDQYFRRLQAHGVRRLIVWLSPFPYVADPANYPAEDWQRYARQARAILDDEALTRALEARTGFMSWGWLRYLLAARLQPEFGQLVGQSAEEHGIALTVCFRPFEAALTKYYEVPAFEHDGTYLWGFLPLASPTINYHPDQVGWAHYREVLRELGHADAAELAVIELPGVTNPAQFVGQPGFQITAAQYPPLADDSFVLVRELSSEFRLRPFGTLREPAEKKLKRVDGFRVEASADGLRLSGLAIPRDSRYLILSWTGPGDGPDLAALSPVILRAKAGNRLGRETTYWVLGGDGDLPHKTRVAWITANGEYWTEFQASEASQKSLGGGPSRLSLAGRQLVIDLGAAWTVEMIDFNRPLARRNAVNEIAAVLKHPGFDDIIINTRSHVDLPLSLADGDQGLLPAGRYWHAGRGPRSHWGLDKAYAPRSATSLDLLGELAKEPGGVERITTWQPDEWLGTCQTLDGPRWRYARNRGTADGVRLLLEDLERAFPGRRIRALIPPSAAAVERVLAGLDRLEQPTIDSYGRGFYHQLWPGNNYIPDVGEGMAMVDLRGLSVEPTFLGSGSYLPGKGTFELCVRECVNDLADNRGSSYRGPRSYFFEGQHTLRAPDLAAARRGREEMICHLLAQRQDIGEVILYEAADWLYYLPLSDTDLCGHGFLDRCGAK